MLVEHGPHFLAEIREIAGVQTHALEMVTLLFQLLADDDGVGQSLLQGVIGVEEQDGVVGMHLCIGTECLQLRVKALDPAVGNRPTHGHAFFERQKDVGCRSDTAHEARPAGAHTAVSLRASETEVDDAPPLGRAHHTTCLGGDERLEVHHTEDETLEELGLDERALDRDDGFARKDDLTFGYGRQVPGEPHLLEHLEKIVSVPQRTQVRKFIRCESHVEHILDGVAQTGRDSISSSVGILPIEDVEHGLVPRLSGQEVTLRHGILVVVRIQWRESAVIRLSTSFIHGLAPFNSWCHSFSTIQYNLNVSLWSTSHTTPVLVKVRANSRMTCLLYTSPSPRDRTRSRMPSSA